MKGPLTIGLKNKFPFIKWIGFKYQLDLDKQPYFCLFYSKNNRTDRILILGK